MIETLTMTVTSEQSQLSDRGDLVQLFSSFRTSLSTSSPIHAPRARRGRMAVKGQPVGGRGAPTWKTSVNHDD